MMIIKVRNGIKRYISMVFLADTIVMQLGSGFDMVMDTLKSSLRTIGSRCMLAGVEVLRSLVSFMVKMAHNKDMDSRRIFPSFLMEPMNLSKKGYLV
jgi:hypothetical protein